MSKTTPLEYQPLPYRLKSFEGRYHPWYLPVLLQDVTPTTEIHRMRRIHLGTSGGSEASQRTIPIISARRYEGAIRNAIRQWKYDGVIELTLWFATWAVAAHDKFTECDEGGDEAWLSAHPSVAIPVLQTVFARGGTTTCVCWRMKSLEFCTCLL